MSRLLLHVEGETEAAFVEEVLAPHLLGSGYGAVGARLLGNARRRDRRGGIRDWRAVRREIANCLKEDPGSRATTMVDYYALPRGGQGAWPGRARASTLPFVEKASVVESELLAEVQREMGARFDAGRFVPYVMMHEFEALLFSDCDGFARGIGRPEVAVGLQAIRDGFASPEEIDDSPETAPSKRVESLVSGYQKPLMGALAALEIGLGAMRRECRHFGAWLGRLEALAGH